MTESRQPLTENSPIWVRHGVVYEGPPTPHLDRHPYGEFGIVLEGKGISRVEREEAWRLPGDLFLLGPGIPHWGRIKVFPLRFITVYFLPAGVIGMDLVKDGFRFLRRFTARQSLATRLVRPSRQLLTRLVPIFQALTTEFERQRFDRDIRLRTLLLAMIVLLLRWEESKSIAIARP